MFKELQFKHEKVRLFRSFIFKLTKIKKIDVALNRRDKSVPERAERGTPDTKNGMLLLVGGGRAETVTFATIF